MPEIGETRVHASTPSIELLSTVDSGRAADETAELLFARYATDLPIICELFGVEQPLPTPVQVVLTAMPEGMPAAHQGTTIWCDVAAGAASSPRLALYSCHLLATQLVHVVAASAGPHWSARTAHGEALSRAIAGSLYPRWRNAWACADDWLSGDRRNAVAVAGEPNDLEAVGCASLFLDYLHHELDLDWRTITRAGGATLAVTYRRASGALNEPFDDFAALLTDLMPAGAGPAVAEPTPAPVAPPALTTDAPLSTSLSDVLAHRRWWLVDTPVRHLRVEDVFVSAVYDQIVATFRERMARGDFSRSLAGYDASAAAVTPANAGGFGVFLTREWHDLIATLLGVQATGDVIATLHHHAPGSASGTIHNDLNPGWFPQHDDDSSVCVHDPAVSNYRTGSSSTGISTVERTRGISLLYYLDTPPAIIGGDTCLYRSAQQPVDQPDVRVPPKNNSLVAFECTPFSYHTFISNLGVERNCLVMWLHRDRAATTARWGNESIVGWT
ncbi:MAG: 2OG-Fe(II) oxygenase [Jatrophihabitans sp.]